MKRNLGVVYCYAITVAKDISKVENFLTKTVGKIDANL